MKYNVVLETFEGPFDLLFHLIEKNEVDIYDIPIAKITDQYIEYLESLKFFDLEVTSEFLVMAATLLEIKSKMLLPKQDEEDLDLEDEGVDPREELVKRLIEYKKYKEAAGDLKSKEEVQSKVFYKPQEEIEEFTETEEQLMLEGVKLIDLIDAFNKLMEKNLGSRNEISFEEIKRDEVTIEESMAQIEKILKHKRSVGFNELFKEKMTRGSIVVTFLSILELIKIKKVTIIQDGNFREITLILRDRHKTMEDLNG